MKSHRGRPLVCSRIAGGATRDRSVRGLFGVRLEGEPETVAAVLAQRGHRRPPRWPAAAPAVAHEQGHGLRQRTHDPDPEPEAVARERGQGSPVPELTHDPERVRACGA
eukprot:355051-Chlamydomonas_euryale.AAC.4